MRARPVTVVAVAVAVAGVGATAVSALVLASGATPEGTTRPGEPAPDVRRPAPPLAGRDPVTGKAVSLADFDGKPVVLHVWSSWCGGCEREAAAIGRFTAAHPETPVLGLDVQDSAEDARAFVRRAGWTHASISDPEGEQAARLELTRLPTTIFLNADHAVVARIDGPAGLPALREALAQATATPS